MAKETLEKTTEQLSITINAAQSQFFEEKPDGDYPVTVEKIEFVPSKNNPANKLVKVQLRVDETADHHSNSVIFDNFNIINENPVAQRIGSEQFSTFVYALGINSLKVPADLPSLVGKKLVVNLWTAQSAKQGKSYKVAA